MALPENDLISRAQNGDVDAFCLLVSGHQRVMYALALRFCSNHHDAEDLVQEVFLSAYRAIRSFRGESTFHTWLRRIMVNSFLSHKRRKELPASMDVTGGVGFPDTQHSRSKCPRTEGEATRPNNLPPLETHYGDQCRRRNEP